MYPYCFLFFCLSVPLTLKQTIRLLVASRARTTNVICPRSSFFTPLARAIIWHSGAKMLDTVTRLHISMPASRSADSKLCSLFLWKPTPFVKNICFGTIGIISLASFQTYSLLFLFLTLSRSFALVWFQVFSSSTVRLTTRHTCSRSYSSCSLSVLLPPLVSCRPTSPSGGNERMIGHLSSSRRKFHERREGGEAGTECEEHPFLAGLRPAAVQDLPQDKQNGG